MLKADHVKAKKSEKSQLSQCLSQTFIGCRMEGGTVCLNYSLKPLVLLL